MMNAADGTMTDNRTLVATVPTQLRLIDNEIRLTPIDVISLLILTGILVVGGIGNSLVIYVFGYKRKTRRIQRFEGFLILLGIVDLISSIFVPISFMYLTATKFQYWHFGDVGCKFIPSLIQISVSVSQGVLIIISYERYRTLVKPFSDQISKPKILLCMIVVLAFSVLFVWPYMSTFHIVEDPTSHTKTCVPDANKMDMLLGSACLQLTRDSMAFGVMALLGYRMNCALVKQHDNLTWKREKMSRKGRRLLKIVVAVFLILTIPLDFYQVIVYIIFNLNYYVSLDGYKGMRTLNTFLSLLQVSNSVVNVFIYSRMHSKFRLQCCIQPRHKRSKSNYTSYGESMYEVTETEFLNIEGRKISRHQRRSEVAETMELPVYL